MPQETKFAERLNIANDVVGIGKNYSDAAGHYGETFRHGSSAAKKAFSSDLKGAGNKFLKATKSSFRYL